MYHSVRPLLRQRLSLHSLHRALNITLVFASSGDRDPEKLFMIALNYLTQSNAKPFNVSYGTSGEILPFASSIWYSKVVGHSIVVADDRTVDSSVVAFPGAFGIAMFDTSLVSRRARLQLTTGEVVADTPAATYQCMVDTFDTSSNRFSLHTSSRSGCWPLATVAYTAVRLDNTEDVCTNTARALKFLQYLHGQTSPTAELAASFFATTNVDALTAAALAGFAANGLVASTDVADQIGLQWMPPNIRGIVQKTLQTITCEGETILVTLPVPHRLSDDIEATGLAISIVGFVLVAILLCFLYFFHLRTAIKASSPWFLLATLTGIVLLFVSGASLSVATPTNATCRSGWWTLNMGFFLTFAPLFAKCWRIYKIFMRKEMTVIRITDSKLALRLIVAFSCELVSDARVCSFLLQS
jgi:heme/copper-type cytochrome/quinol oxidase subunit 4